MVVANRENIEDFANEITELVDGVIAGHVDNGDKAYLDDDATDAANDIEDLMSRSGWGESADVWEFSEWIDKSIGNDVKSSTNDRELRSLAREYLSAAERDGVVLDRDFDDIFDYLKTYRDDIRYEEDNY